MSIVNPDVVGFDGLVHSVCSEGTICGIQFDGVKLISYSVRLPEITCSRCTEAFIKKTEETYLTTLPEDRKHLAREDGTLYCSIANYKFSTKHCALASCAECLRKYLLPVGYEAAEATSQMSRPPEGLSLEHWARYLGFSSVEDMGDSLGKEDL